jgi:hypothetical protein
MKALKRRIVKQNFIYTQIQREGNIAIYEQASRSPAKSGHLHFEVIVISRAIQKHVLGETVLREKGDEIYPGIGKWGTMGWTHMTLHEAEKKFHTLLAKRNES